MFWRGGGLIWNKEGRRQGREDGEMFIATEPATSLSRLSIRGGVPEGRADERPGENQEYTDDRRDRGFWAPGRHGEAAGKHRVTKAEAVKLRLRRGPRPLIGESGKEGQ